MSSETAAAIAALSANLEVVFAAGVAIGVLMLVTLGIVTVRAVW